MTEIATRFVELMKLLDKNPNSFANDIGVSASIIYNIIGGRFSKPGYDVLEKTKKTYPQVNMNWVISGEGMPKMDNENVLQVAGQLENLSHRMQQLEKLTSLRDQHVLVLTSHLDMLKKDIQKAKKN